jgi:hypothetical protein
MNVLSIIGWWTLLSVTLGPCVSWLFFRAERDYRVEDEAFELELQSASNIFPIRPGAYIPNNRIVPKFHGRPSHG